MALRLTILSPHAGSLGERARKEFGQAGGTIGRSLSSDWVLPDSERFVSSRHAGIDFRSGSYYIVDTSKNGVYVNDAEQPVGRGKPQRLFSGDRIKIGDYEIGVEIDDDEVLPDVEPDHVDPVDLAQRVEAPEPTGCDLVDAYEVTGVGIEELLTEDEAETLTPPSKLDDVEIVFELEEEPAAKTPAKRAASAKPAPARNETKAPTTGAKPARAAASPAKPSAPAAQAPRAQAPRPPAPQSQAAARTSAAKPPAGAGAARAKSPSEPEANLVPMDGARASAALEAFFRGAGITPQRVDPARAEIVLQQLGQLLREMIVGITESLHLRANQKNSLRLPNTTIQQQNNNPLKFSAGVEEALTNLVFRESSEYLAPVDAVREAFADVRLHQQALLRALSSALDAYARRLDPDELEQKFSRGKSGGLIGAANKLKYWDLYKDLYQIVAHHPPGELPAQFLDDFAHAYDAEVERAPARHGEKKAQTG